MSASAAPRRRMSIGEVLERLRPEFSDISISKIRFLESEGLIAPERTPSGYRKFTHADVERLRYVLTSQREHYLPLKVIREHLDAIDRGLEPPSGEATSPRVPRLALARDGFPTAESFAPDPSELRVSRQELLESADIDEQLLDQLEAFGLVAARAGSEHYDRDALAVARIAGEMAAFGLEPRHLRTFKTAADREVGLVEQVVTPLRRGRDADSRARAEDAAQQMAALSVSLHASLVKSGLGRGR